MACSSTTTAPINIDPATVTGQCDLKCALAVKYSDSHSSSLTNHGDYLSLTYDTSTNAPVKYNLIGYTVAEIRIYTPSLHQFSGSKLDAEIIVRHTSDRGMDPLFICVPCRATTSTSAQSAVTFAAIVDSASQNAPTNGETTQCDTWSLAQIVPKKPFYTYTATVPYQPCESTVVNYVVFDSSAAIDILTDSLTKLTKIVSKNAYDIKPTKVLFYNAKGVGSAANAAGDDIYIDCQPVGESDTKTDVVVSSSGGAKPLSIEDLMKNPLIILLLSSVGFIALIFVLFYLVKFLGGLAR